MKLITFVVFQFWVLENCKSALSEKNPVIHYFCLKGLPLKKMHKDIVATLAKVAPSDYFLFPKMKKELSGLHFDSYDD